MPSQSTPYSHFEPAGAASAPLNPRHAAIGGFAVGGFLAFAAALAALMLYCDPKIQTRAEVTAETPPVAHKFAVDFSTPVELQEYRGTCWIFAAVAVLEWSYRSQGVARGWLSADQYVRLSEQAFGVAVLDACRALDDGTSCVVGDEVWHGRQLLPRDLEGGEPTLLFYLSRLSKTAALPWSVCPYIAKPGRDGECPGLAEARATNPLTFSLTSIDWLYERRAVTQRLRETQRLMTLSTPLLTVRYLLPCTAASAHVLTCDPKDEEECRACPAEPAFGGAACCVVSERDSSTMGGEFFRLPSGSHLEPVLEGAHAMALVGYSDVFRSQQGFVGGYIVKNSWWDGLPPGPGWKQARGSHSVAFFMQQVSPADEAAVCPNAHSPQSWYQCGSVRACRSNKTAAFARAANQPLHLTCLDASPFLRGLCRKGEPLFLRSIAPFGGGLATACFLRDRLGGGDDGDEEKAVVNRRRVEEQPKGGGESGDGGDGGGGGDGGEGGYGGEGSYGGERGGEAGGGGHHSHDSAGFCSPPVPIGDLALVVAPVEAERLPNDPELCGHYFFPFELAEGIHAAYGGFEVSDMEVRWPDSAFAANKAEHPHLDYRLLERDTRSQGRVRKGAPFLAAGAPTWAAADEA